MTAVRNDGLVSAFLGEKGLYPAKNAPGPGLDLRLEGGRLMLSGGADDLIELADLLVALALSQGRGDHWHIDSLTLVDPDSPIPEVILLRRDD